MPMTNLCLFTGAEVTAEERALAKEKYGKRELRIEKSKLAFGSKIDPWVRVEKQSIGMAF